MPYNQVFGGQTVYPSQVSLLVLNPLTVNTALSWPLEALPGTNVIAWIVEVNPNAGLALTLDDARKAASGNALLVNNVGANTITIKDNAGNTIGTVASGVVKMFYLSDNSTAAGTWRVFTFGTGASSADAAALAGAGLKAITTTLNVKVAPSVTNTTPINVVDADRAKAFIWNGGVGVLNLPSAVAVGSDWLVYVRNAGTGNLTVTPAAGNIDGAATKTIRPSESALIVTDGINFYTIGYATNVAGFFDYIAINVGGAAGDYTLTGAELNRIAYKFTGVLTGNRNVVVPTAVQQYWVNNATTGAFTVTVKTLAGTGVLIPQGFAGIVYCDGTNVVAANGDPLTGITPLALGGLGVALTDPNNDRILFWDDSAGAMAFLTVGAGLQLSGTTLTATDELTAVKTADTSRNSTTTPTADPHLSVTVEVGTYIMELFLLVTTISSTPGLRLKLDGGSATFAGNIDYGGWASTGAGAGTVPIRASANVNNDLTLTAAGPTNSVYKFTGVFKFSAPGTFAVSWAQAVNNAANVTLLSQSAMTLKKVA